MFSLPVIKTPKYLSPTAILQHDRCALQFYYQRMSDLDVEREPQAKPAGVGSAFDAYVTREVAKALGLGDSPDFALSKLLGETVEAHNFNDVIPYGEALTKCYIDTGCFERLMNDGINDLHHISEKTLVDEDGVEITLHGRPDLGFSNGGRCELKVNGAFSARGQSPKPGYIRAFDVKGKPKGSHAKYKELENNFENVDPSWAVQLTIYGWLAYGTMNLGRPLYAGVEQVAISKTNVVFASFRGYISEEFQRKLRLKVMHIWKQVQEGKIPFVQAEQYRCNQFGKLCHFAPFCESYKMFMANEKDLLI